MALMGHTRRNLPSWWSQHMDALKLDLLEGVRMQNVNVFFVHTSHVPSQNTERDSDVLHLGLKKKGF